MTCIGVAQATALRVEDGVEAGDEHVGWDAGMKRFVNSLEHLAGWREAPGCEAQHPAGGGHDQSRWHSLACCISHRKPQFALREEVEVVEITSHLLSRAVVRSEMPALQFWHLLG